MSKSGTRRFETWRKVAGSTYASWLVDNERRTNRAAALVFALGASLSVASLAALLVMPTAWASVLGITAALAVAIGVLWWMMTRRGGQLPSRIANDLWSRGFPVLGVPPVFQDRDFLLWVARNGATPEQLESAALAPIVQDPPQRTAGITPTSLKWARALGLAALGSMCVSAVSLAANAIVDLLATGWIGELGSNPGVLGPVLHVIGAAFGGLVLSYALLFAAQGSGKVRKLVTWGTPFIGIDFLLTLIFAPAMWLFAGLGAALWVVCVALLWSRSANGYVVARDDIDRALINAVAERKRT